MHQWLDEYGASHRNETNELLHWICVPTIALTVVGFLWAIPVPDAFAAASPWLNWATIGVALWIAYYFLLSPSLGVGATLCLVGMLFIVLAGHPALAAVVHLPGDLRRGVDRSIHRPLHRGHPPLVLQGRAVPVDWPDLAGVARLSTPRPLLLGQGVHRKAAVLVR